LSRNASLFGLGALLAGVGMLALGCGLDHSQLLTPAAPDPSGSSAVNGAVSVRFSAASSSVDGTPAGIGRPLSNSGIARLFLTFDTIRLYPTSDSMPGHGPGSDSLPPNPRPDSLPPGHGHHGGLMCPADTSYIEILTSPVTVDALQLADTLGTLLTSANVPAGNYLHLALRISAASAVTDSGATVTVALASPNSLLRVLGHFSVVEGQAVEIQIRIDLDRSVREVPPGSGNWVLMPAISGEMHRHGGGGMGGGHGGMGGGGMGGHGGGGRGPGGGRP